MFYAILVFNSIAIVFFADFRRFYDVVLVHVSLVTVSKHT